MIHFDQVSKRFSGNKDALYQANLHLQKGEMVFITGHSGAGKSTLLKLIMLMERPTAGRINVAGQEVTQLARRQIPFYRRQFGVVFQDHQLLMDRSVFDNVMLPLAIVGYQFKEAERKVRAALDKVGLLDKEHLSPLALSSGEQQRVGIARAVVHKPSVLLADEPTGNLDPQLSNEIMKLFEAFNQVGVTVLIASHDLALIARLKHRIITLSQGRIISDS